MTCLPGLHSDGHMPASLHTQCSLLWRLLTTACGRQPTPPAMLHMLGVFQAKTCHLHTDLVRELLRGLS